MRKTVNNTHIEGYIYEHSLKAKVSGENSKHPGTPFINGSLKIATDDDCLNVVEVHFSYVTEITSSGKVNQTYGTLMNIIDGKLGSVMENGKENAAKIRVDSAIGLNEWYDTRSNDCPLVSAKRNEGGFIHTIQTLSNDPNQRATFEVDMVMTNFRRIEADPERNLPEKGTIKGCIFDFRGTLLPITLSVTSPKALDYLESLEFSDRNPLFTRVKGIQVSKTVVKRIEEEGAWGEVSVREVKNSQRDFVITWMQSVPYEWDSEDSILATELIEKISERDIYLADLKRRNQEYRASAATASTSGTTKVNMSPKGQEYLF